MLSNAALWFRAAYDPIAVIGDAASEAEDQGRHDSIDSSIQDSRAESRTSFHCTQQQSGSDEPADGLPGFSGGSADWLMVVAVEAGQTGAASD